MAVAIAKRDSPAEAAVLLGALRADRARRRQAATPPEIDGEARYEKSLRRALGDQFDALYAQGLAFDETPMISLQMVQVLEFVRLLRASDTKPGASRA